MLSASSDSFASRGPRYAGQNVSEANNGNQVLKEQLKWASKIGYVNGCIGG